MDEKELKSIAAVYFGFTPSTKIPKNLNIEIIEPEHSGSEEAKKIKIKWENHIGSESKVARITPLDIMYYLGMKNTKDNYNKAVAILMDLAALNNLPVVKIDEKYLLVNSKHRG